MKTEIYIATHKKTSFPKSDDYIPIHVGKNLSEVDLGIIGDDTQSNISYLNKSFCELTALYWIWKNSKAENVGLVHYRRYFITHNIGEIFYNKNIITCKEIEEKLKNCDVILPEKERVAYYKIMMPVQLQYAISHNNKDWKILGEFIKENKPDYYDAFKKVSSSFYISCYNMFIMNKSILNNYAQWLFDILLSISEKKDISKYDAYQSRIYGFMSERLLNVYFYKHKDDFNICYLPVDKLEL